MANRRRKVPFRLKTEGPKKAKYERYEGIKQPGAVLTDEERFALEQRLKNEPRTRSVRPPVSQEEKPFWDRATPQQIASSKKRARVIHDPPSHSVGSGKARHGNIPKKASEWFEVQVYNQNANAPAWLTVDYATKRDQATRRANMEEVTGKMVRIMHFKRDDGGYQDSFQLQTYNRATDSWSTVGNYSSQDEALSQAKTYERKGLRVRVLHRQG